MNVQNNIVFSMLMYTLYVGAIIASSFSQEEGGENMSISDISWMLPWPQSEESVAGGIDIDVHTTNLVLLET